METIPISSLEGLRDTAHKQVQGVITLVWPYSSLTHSAAFLLAESDFRLRYKKGQVRVQLRGPAAVAVAQARLGIGDVVTLQLGGARWAAAEEDVVSTPGRSVDLELAYSAKLDLQIGEEDSQTRQVHVNEPEEYVPQSTVSNITSSLLATPRAITPIPRRLRQEPTQATPVFHQKARLSGGSAVDSLLDPFGDEGLDSTHQHKKPRISWGTPNRWKVVRQTPSPQKAPLKKEDDAFWLGSQSSRKSDSEQTPSASSANSGTTSPIDDAELTQIVQEAQQAASERTKAHHVQSQDESSSGRFEMYRDPSAATMPFNAKFGTLARENIPTRSSRFSSAFSAASLQQASKTVESRSGPEQNVIEILSDSESDSNSSDQDAAKSEVEVVDNIAKEALDTLKVDSSSVVVAEQFRQEDLRTLPNVEDNSKQPMETESASMDDSTILTSSHPAHHNPPDGLSLQQDIFSKPRTPENQPLQSPNLPFPSPFPHEQLGNIFVSDLAQPRDYAVYSAAVTTASASGPIPASEDRVEQTSPSTGIIGALALNPENLDNSQIPVDEQLQKSSMMETQSRSFDDAIAVSSHHFNIDLREAREIFSGTAQREPASFEGLMTHVSDSQQGTDRHLSFDQLIMPGTEGQGQPTGSFASADHPHDQGSFNLSTSTFLSEDAGIRSADAGLYEAPASADHYKDEIDAILGQVPSYATDSRFSNAQGSMSKALLEDGAGANAMSSFADLPQAVTSTADDGETGVIHRHDDGLQAYVDLEPAEQDQSSLSLASKNATMDMIDETLSLVFVAKRVTTSEFGGIEQPQEQPPQVPSSPPDADLPKSSALTQSTSSVPLYPNLSQPLRTIPETATGSSQDVDTALPQAVNGSQSSARAGTNQRAVTPIRSTLTRPNKMSSSQVRGFTGSSSAVDIMAFFSGTPARLSKETTAVSAELVAAARSPDQHAKSSQNVGSHLDTPRRTLRRPGEVRKVLKMPQPLVPSAKLQPAVTQQSGKEGSVDIHGDGHAAGDAPRRVTRASSRRSQSVVSELAENVVNVQQLHSPLPSPTRRRMSKSTIIESIETIAEPMETQSSNLVSGISPVKQSHRSEPDSTIMSATQEERPTQSKIEDALETPQAGLRTSYSYYVPLSELSAYLNKPTAFDSTVDVLAVVYRATSDAVKADKGRKDWFTKMRITQPHFWRNTTLVQVFRGYKSAVPRAEAGDVILLRSFLVTGSKRGGIALKSGDGSAWCVFKAAAVSSQSRRKPVGARDGQKEDDAAGEVMSGPPAEFGNQERQAAEHLKEWWKVTKVDLAANNDKNKSHL